MKNCRAMALNILYGNTAQPPLRPHTQPPPLLPLFPRSINNGVRRRECATNRLCERGKRKRGEREGECLLHCKERLRELSMAGETERQWREWGEKMCKSGVKRI